jgi:hypothetical protein
MALSGVGAANNCWFSTTSTDLAFRVWASYLPPGLARARFRRSGTGRRSLWLGIMGDPPLDGAEGGRYPAFGAAFPTKVLTVSRVHRAEGKSLSQGPTSGQSRLVVNRLFP